MAKQVWHVILGWNDSPRQSPLASSLMPSRRPESGKSSKKCAQNVPKTNIWEKENP